MNNVKAFPTFDGIICSYQCPDQLQLLPEYWQAKRYRISWDHQKRNLLENNPNHTRDNMKSQIENKRNGISVYEITNTNIKQNF